jgi:hypothetical protein
MSNKNIKRLIYFIVLLGIIIYRYVATGNEPKTTREESNQIVLNTLQNKPLVYTDHAKCRMDCRYISEEEVLNALKNGKINSKKSYPNDEPCSTFAIEDNTLDGQSIRIIFANCNEVVKVVTAIDLNQEHQCYCK